MNRMAGATGTKWSKVRVGAGRVLEECMENGGQATDILTDPYRFQTPVPVPNMPDKIELDGLLRHVNPACGNVDDPAVLWGTAYSLMLHRYLRQPTASEVFLAARVEDPGQTPSKDGGATCPSPPL
eukprot:3700494-Pyramimonas_sp.AAC.1